MTITIEYCTMWSYEPRAVRLAAEIRQQYPDAKIDLKRSSGGRFEVSRDGVPIYEKSKTGRFPNPGEVLDMLGK